MLWWKTFWGASTSERHSGAAVRLMLLLFEAACCITAWAVKFVKRGNWLTERLNTSCWTQIIKEKRNQRCSLHLTWHCFHVSELCSLTNLISCWCFQEPKVCERPGRGNWLILSGRIPPAESWPQISWNNQNRCWNIFLRQPPAWNDYVADPRVCFIL